MNLEIVVVGLVSGILAFSMMKFWINQKEIEKDNEKIYQNSLKIEKLIKQKQERMKDK